MEVPPPKTNNLKIERLESHNIVDKTGKPLTKTQFTQIDEENEFTGHIRNFVSGEVNSDLEEEEEILKKKTSETGTLLLPLPMKNKVRVLYLHGLCGYCSKRFDGESRGKLKKHLYLTHMLGQDNFPMECLEKGCYSNYFEVSLTLGYQKIVQI